MARLYDPRYDDPLDGFESVLIGGRDRGADRRAASRDRLARVRVAEHKQACNNLGLDGFGALRHKYPITGDRGPR